jgi:uncharacterized protein (TIGR03083 family)
MPLDHAACCRHIDEEAAEVQRLLDGARPEVLAAAVPACPGWTVRDLVGHLGGIHRWATGIVRTRERGDVPDPPDDDAALGPWFAEGAAALTAALREADPAADCWALARPGTVGFWSRRQAHETAVHRVDLADALGVPAPLDPGLAADGVDEVATMFFPRQVRLGREAPLTDALALVDRDGGRWLLAGDGTGGVGSAPQATVSGAAGDLLLLLWKRRRLDDLDVGVTGDLAGALRVLGARLTP